MASSEKDRKLLKLAVCEAQGLSAKEASQKYSVYNLNQLKEDVNHAINQTQEIRNAVIALAKVEEKATLEVLGIFVEDENSEEEEEHESFDVTPVEMVWDSASDESEDDGEELKGKDNLDNQQKDKDTLVGAKGMEQEKRTGDMDQDILDPDTLLKDASVVNPIPSMDQLVYILREKNLNWFAFVHELQTLLNNHSPMVLHQALLDFAHRISESDLLDEEEKIVEQSRQAFEALQRERGDAQEHHDIETDSESDNPDEWVGITEVLSNEGKRQVLKQRKNFKRKARREAAKEIVDHVMKCGMKDCILKPPSEVIKDAFVKSLPSKKKSKPQPLDVKDLAKKTLLPESEVSFWIEHLKTSKKEGKKVLKRPW